MVNVSQVVTLVFLPGLLILTPFELQTDRESDLELINNTKKSLLICLKSCAPAGTEYLNTNASRKLCKTI